MAQYALVFDASTGKWIAKTDGLLSAHIANAAIISAKLASGAIGPDHIAYAAILSGHIASGQVGISHIRHASVLSGHIASGQIGPSHQANASTLSGHIASGQIGPSHLANASVLSGHIASGQVGASHHGNASVLSGHIASGQVGQSHVGNAQILSGHIASGQIGSSHYQNASVLSGHIASGQIGSDHLAAGIVMPSATKARYLEESTYMSVEAIVSHAPVFMGSVGIQHATQISGGMPVFGLVPVGVASGIAAVVRFAGICPGNVSVISGQRGKTVFAASGAVTLTSPTTSGKVSQILGTVFDDSNIFIQINTITVDIAG